MSDAWLSIQQTVNEEFHDLADVPAWTRAVVRLLAALLMSGLLGFERTMEGKAAGLRTHMLVGLGSALIVLAPALAGMQVADMSRVIQGIVTGVGFLGAGTILKLREHEEVKGLTTAAGLWTTAAVGMTCGTGHLGLAILSTALALIVLTILGRFENRLETRRQSV